MRSTRTRQERHGNLIHRLRSDAKTCDIAVEAGRILEEAALDKYVFQRDAYFQRRRSLIYDGSPPREKLE